MTFSRFLVVFGVVMVALCAYEAATTESLGLRIYFVACAVFNARGVASATRWWSR